MNTARFPDEPVRGIEVNRVLRRRVPTYRDECLRLNLHNNTYTWRSDWPRESALGFWMFMYTTLGDLLYPEPER